MRLLVRWSKFLLLLLAVGFLGVASESEAQELPECPPQSELPNQFNVSASWYAQCSHCYASPTVTPTAFGVVPTATPTGTSVPTATPTRTLTPTPSQSATPDDSAWSSLVSQGLLDWYADLGSGYFAFFLPEYGLQSGYATPVRVPPFNVVLVSAYWEVLGASEAYYLSAQPAYGSRLTLWDDQYEDFPFGLSGSQCVYENGLGDIYEWTCNAGYVLGQWPFHEYEDGQREAGLFDWATSNQEYELSFGFQWADSQIPTPAASDVRIRVALVGYVFGGGQSEPGSTLEPSLTPTSTGTVTETFTPSPVLPDWFWSSPLLNDAFADHPGGDSYWHEPVLGSAIAAEDVAAIVLKVTETGSCDVETRFRAESEGWNGGGQNQTYAVFYGNSLLSTIQTMFADKFPGVTPVWHLWAYDYTIYSQGTFFEFSARIGWNCSGSQWSEAWFLYYGSAPVNPTLPPTWTPTITNTPRPTKTPWPTATGTVSPPNGVCFNPQYVRSPTPSLVTPTVSPTVVTLTPSASLTVTDTFEPQTAVAATETRAVVETATQQFYETPYNFVTATAGARSTAYVATLQSTPDIEFSPGGSVGEWTPVPGVVDIPDNGNDFSIDDTNPLLYVDMGGDTVAGNCYEIIPSSQKLKLTDSYAVCVRWVSFPKVRLLNFRLPIDVVLVVVFVAIYRRIWRL